MRISPAPPRVAQAPSRPLYSDLTANGSNAVRRPHAAFGLP